MTLILFMILVITAVVNVYGGNWTIAIGLCGVAWAMLKAHNADVAADANHGYLKAILKKQEKLEEYIKQVEMNKVVGGL